MHQAEIRKRKKKIVDIHQSFDCIELMQLSWLWKKSQILMNRLNHKNNWGSQLSGLSLPI